MSDAVTLALYPGGEQATESALGQILEATLDLGEKMPPDREARELLLQFFRVGHAEGRPVNVKSAVLAPATRFVHDRLQGRADTLQQSLQDLYGKTAACIAVSSFAELLVREVLKPGNGKVAVDNLGNKEVNCRSRVENTLAKAVADFAAHLGYLLSIENLSEI